MSSTSLGEEEALDVYGAATCETAAMKPWVWLAILAVIFFVAVDSQSGDGDESFRRSSGERGSLRGDHSGGSDARGECSMREEVRKEGWPASLARLVYSLENRERK